MLQVTLLFIPTSPALPRVLSSQPRPRQYHRPSSLHPSFCSPCCGWSLSCSELLQHPKTWCGIQGHQGPWGPSPASQLYSLQAAAPCLCWMNTLGDFLPQSFRLECSFPALPDAFSSFTLSSGHLFQEDFLDTTTLPGWVRTPLLGPPVYSGHHTKPMVF